MTTTDSAYDDIRFYDKITDHDLQSMAGCVVHILCIDGNASFYLHETRYNVGVSDYVILPNAALASRFEVSSGFSAVIMSLSVQAVTSLAIRSDYGVVGHLSLLQNPVMRLTPHDFEVCLEGMSMLKRRMSDTGHLFHREMIGHLLTAHVLDLYDIHARGTGLQHVPERTADLLARFVTMLHEGEYETHRDLGYYASRLCVTPHYLSEVCRRISGMSASYWIDRFTVSAIVRLLGQKDLPMSAIAERFNFSSQSYFCRYVQRHTGMPPTVYRAGAERGRQ